MKQPLIEVKNLHVSFHYKNDRVQVIRGVDLQVVKGEIIGILGESGSGKTVTASTLSKLYEGVEGNLVEGEIYFDSIDILKASEKVMNTLRGKRIAYVFQNPTASLNPYRTIGKQLKSAQKNHQIATSYNRIIKALEEVGISEPEQVYSMYPSQLSGGQNQRIMIAQAILCEPDVLIADEPTSSIDASHCKKILDLLKELNLKYAMSIVLITHDFDVAKYICHRIMIMYGGLILEEGTIQEVFNKPLHPYTQELMKCVLSLEQADSAIYSLEGTPLTPLEFRNECPFYLRCSLKEAICKAALPKMQTVESRKVRCIRYESEENE
jgi:oligopeptide/dipeptide ABC transporter ATP-binding protein